MTTIEAKSVMIGRRPTSSNHESWIAMISFFKDNNPHLKAKVPFHVEEFPSTEKVRLRELRNVSYYLAGNDLVVNNLTSVSLDKQEGIITLRGKQELPS
ncbi:MAG: hypothetical protein CMH61_01930 [Nanoarchaeota archaeon]|nr:hypothetical protein [Nanoarchaeota archaeon]|tara:strand:+ start:302 stop:598 length:297 start_codon:yes stop_codon:yes gene_type:complete